MKLVILESPYAGNIVRNVAYARACVRDSILRGEAPLASHLLYTQKGILRDVIPEERKLGIEAGLAWGKHAELTVVYADFGVTEGMKKGVARAEAEGRPVEVRSLPDWKAAWGPESESLDEDDNPCEPCCFAKAKEELFPFCYLDEKGFVRAAGALIDASKWDDALGRTVPDERVKPWKPMLQLPFRNADGSLATEREKIIEWCWIWGTSDPDAPLDYDPKTNLFRQLRLQESKQGYGYFRQFCKLHLSAESLEAFAFPDIPRLPAVMTDAVGDATITFDALALERERES